MTDNTQDYLLTTIYNQIQEQRKNSFTFFANNGGVEPWFDLRVSAPTIFGARTTESESYELIYLTSKPKQIIELRYKPSTNPRIQKVIDDIQIKFQGRWRAVKKWLWDRFGERNIGKASQKDWWATNGKFFPLMNLPKELRYCVYAQLFGKFIHPRIEWSYLARRSEEYRFRVIPKTVGSFGEWTDDQLTILLANRTVHHEAKKSFGKEPQSSLKNLTT